MADEFPNIDFTGQNWQAKLYETYFQGTHISSWAFLRHSARSCFLHSVDLTNKILNAYYHRGKQQSLEEKCFLVWFNYGNFLSGPILSSIILSSFAVESFTRHCYTKLLSHDSSSLNHDLKEFDKLSSTKRIEKLMHVSHVSDSIDGGLHAEIKHLIFFRNNVAHDDPLLFRKDGCFEHIKQGDKKIVNENKPYPLLPTTNMPLNLKHSLRAVETHDRFIKFILENCDHKNIAKFKEEIKHTGPLFILKGLPKSVTSETIRTLINQWYEMEYDLLNISPKKMKDIVVNTQRRANIKIIK